MNFIIMGGDTRARYIYEMLLESGHGAFPLALEKELPVLGPPDYRGCHGVILPLPAEREGYLNAPLSVEKHSAAELLAPLCPGTAVFAGMAGESLRQICRERGLPLFDYYVREELQLKNAALTAEGAMELLRPRAGQRVLISGFGRIASLLAQRLLAAGAEVTVAARSALQRARAEAMGCAAVDMGKWGGDYAAVVNTVPAAVFSGADIAAFPDAMLLELASAPYGFDFAAARAQGREIVLAPGLPAKHNPKAAAKAVLDTIFSMLEE